MKKFMRKVFPEQKNPFKSLLLTAALCAVLRVALVILGIIITLSFDSIPMIFVGMVILLLYHQIPDVIFLRPKLKKTFLSPSFSKEHITWLKERQDVSPDQLRVFFRKILSFRASASAISLVINIPSLIIIWSRSGISGTPMMFNPLFFSFFIYVFFLSIKLSFFRSEHLECWPKRYRSDRYNFSYRVRVEK